MGKHRRHIMVDFLETFSRISNQMGDQWLRRYSNATDHAKHKRLMSTSVSMMAKIHRFFDEFYDTTIIWRIYANGPFIFLSKADEAKLWYVVQEIDGKRKWFKDKGGHLTNSKLDLDKMPIADIVPQLFSLEGLIRLMEDNTMKVEEV